MLEKMADDMIEDIQNFEHGSAEFRRRRGFADW